MRDLFYFLIFTVMIMTSVTGIVFGFDRDMARRDYEKAVRDGDFEKPIVGCVWQYNCDYYTNLLYETID